MEPIPSDGTHFPLPLVLGHRIEGEVFHYPHRCPGQDCAIAAWLYRRSVTALWYRQRAAQDLVVAETEAVGV